MPRWESKKNSDEVVSQKSRFAKKGQNDENGPRGRGHLPTPMGFDTIIKNATIVTAVDTTRADVGISGGKISAIAAQLSAENATQTIDAGNHLLLPGGIDVHTHSTCLSAEPCLPTISRLGRLPRPLADNDAGGLRHQYKGQTLRHAFDTWMKKAHGLGSRPSNPLVVPIQSNRFRIGRKSPLRSSQEHTNVCPVEFRYARRH